MKSRRKDDGIRIRHCHGISEFEACVRLERAVWKSADIDVVPIPLFVVASETGGQVLGAFRGKKLVGFTMAIAGWRDGKPFLHSHMTAVLDGYRDQGIGRRLKLFQMEDALARGIGLIEWTFDPLVTKNAHFNLVTLGAIARRYLVNAYGITTSALHFGLPTDRLVAEWHLRSPRVRRAIAGKRAMPAFSEKAVRISVPITFETEMRPDRARALRTQSRIRADFIKWLGKGYAVTSFTPGKAGVDYILEPVGQAMKIQRITLREIHMPLVTPFETSFGRLTNRRMLLVEIDADGIAGWGESVAGEGPFYAPETVETAWLIIRDFIWPTLKNRELVRASDLWEILSHIRGHNMAKGAVEAALWDAEAKQKGIPLWKLLGGVRTELPCGVSIGIKETLDDLVETVERELAAGYQRIKIKIKPGNDIAPVERLRQRFPGVRLMVDANSAYRLEDWPHLKRLEAYYLMMIEQPLGWDDIYSHAELQRKLDTPICLDECIHTEEHARAAIDSVPVESSTSSSAAWVVTPRATDS